MFLNTIQNIIVHFMLNKPKGNGPKICKIQMYST